MTASETSGESQPGVVYHTSIKNWHVSERPRERVLRQGPEALSEAELLGLILGSGTHTKEGSLSAVALGEALLRTYGSLHQLSKRAVKELLQVRGIGPAKAVQIVSAFELGRRALSQAPGDRVQVTSPEDVVRVFGPLMRDLPREIFRIVLLNTANYILSDYVLTEGGLSASIVEPRLIFQKAILDNAASIICLHNHPSGNPEPSAADIAVTRQLVNAGEVMGIPVQDHIIIAGTSYTSLAARGLL